MRNRFLLLLLIGLLIAILIVLAQHGEGTVGPLSTGDFGSLAYKIVLLVFLGGAVLTHVPRAFFAGARPRRCSGSWSGSCWWSAIPTASSCTTSPTACWPSWCPATWSSHGRTRRGRRAAMAAILPSSRRSTARASPMVLDTGASSVVLTREDAKAAGLPLEVLNYTVNIDTANGRARAAPVTLDRLAVGGLVERSVRALVAQPGQLKTSLLGMSFLNRLQSWEVRGDRLVLHGYP